VAVATRSITQRWVARNLPPRPERAHKGDFGRVLVVAGSIEYPGAALLTGLAAMRAGAGLVRVATADSVVAGSSAIPELTWSALDEEAPGLIAPAGDAGPPKPRRTMRPSSAPDSAVSTDGLGSSSRRCACRRSWMRTV
jgi:NAD(P)H-hydrate repair Nnr-like enzyme with NAD(P)H-hydrate dehydratase domain